MSLPIDIDKMTEEQVKEYLKMIVDKLDDLDDQDFFGTVGWKHCLGLED